VTDFLFLGLQAQVGYMQNLAVAPLVPDGGNIPVDVNLVLGFTLADIVNLYAAPGVEFGRRLLKTDGMFGPAIGGNVMAGVAVDLDGTLLILQAKPSVASFSNMSGTFSTDFLLALSWDL
jgi:hypothetical protein